jgi:cytoskeletal protein RodZ
LEAIEGNDYKRLPGGVFNRSFIKAYAKCVGYDEKAAIEGYTRYLREHGESADEVATTPFHSKVYTDTPATRSPILTVVLAVLILGVLTFAALAVLHWYQRRAAVRPGNDHSFVVCKEPIDWANEFPAVSGLGLRKADYKAVVQ